MRVMHVWNTAGVASLISKELKKKGYTSDVYFRTGYDPFGIATYYGDLPIELPAPQYLQKCYEEAEDYDIIHLHAVYNTLPTFRKLYPNKKIIIQHHGTELTQCKDDEYRKYCYTYADHIITSTNDLHELLNKEGTNNTLIENAIDTELFKPIDCVKSDKALAVGIRYINKDSMLKFVSNNSTWEVDVFDRETNYVQYSQMPQLLNYYSKFIDIKCPSWLNGKPVQAYSRTGREALACGLEVLNYKGEIVKGLPKEYTPEYMINKLINVYKTL